VEAASRPDGDTVSVGPPVDEVLRAVRVALDEDLGPAGDLTGSLIDEAVTAKAAIVTRDDGVLAGESCATAAFQLVDANLDVNFCVHDGDRVVGGDVLATVAGSMRSIVAAERTALNFLCHLSGIATATRALVDAVHAVDEHVAVLDTRKTTPGLRALEKAAVRAGGGTNHRASLSDAILLKDNHLGVVSITDAVRDAVRRYPTTRVQVECDTDDQVDEAIAAGATRAGRRVRGPDTSRAARDLRRGIGGHHCHERTCLRRCGRRRGELRGAHPQRSRPRPGPRPVRGMMS
jgi:nicotinate-nucleotide pyrophosphorylase (carboxylating)